MHKNGEDRACVSVDARGQTHTERHTRKSSLQYFATALASEVIVIMMMMMMTIVIITEARELSFLFQRVSVLVQRFNAILLHDCLPAADRTD